MQVLYTAENYDAQSSTNQRLTLGLNVNACAFAVHNNDGALQLLGHFGFYIPLNEDETVFFDFIRSQEALKLKYKTTTVVFEGYKNTPVPVTVYDELYTDAYLRHQFTVEKDEVVKATPLFDGEVQLVFAVRESLFYPARSKYYEAITEPCAATFLRKSTRYYPNRLNVFMEQGRIYLAHCNSKAPVYYNNFPYTTVEEAAYFIMNYYQAFSIPHQSLPVVLHGDSHPQLAEILNSYMGKSEVVLDKNKGVQLPEGFDFEFLIDFCH